MLGVVQDDVEVFGVHQLGNDLMKTLERVIHLHLGAGQIGYLVKRLLDSLGMPQLVNCLPELRGVSSRVGIHDHHHPLAPKL